MITDRYIDAYSSLLFDLAKDQGKTDEISCDFDDLSYMFSYDRGIRRVLSNMMSDQKLKLEIVNTLSKELGCCDMTVAFLNEIGRYGHLHLLPQIVDKLLDKVHKNTTIVNVVTARQLEDDEKKYISSLLTQRFNKQVILRTQIDPRLIGGYKARIENRQIDESLQKEFKELRKILNTDNNKP